MFVHLLFFILAPIMINRLIRAICLPCIVFCYTLVYIILKHVFEVNMKLVTIFKVVFSNLFLRYFDVSAILRLRQINGKLK